MSDGLERPLPQAMMTSEPAIFRPARNQSYTTNVTTQPALAQPTRGGGSLMQPSAPTSPLVEKPSSSKETSAAGPIYYGGPSGPIVVEPEIIEPPLRIHEEASPSIMEETTRINIHFGGTLAHVLTHKFELSAKELSRYFQCSTINVDDLMRLGMPPTELHKLQTKLDSVCIIKIKALMASNTFENFPVALKSIKAGQISWNVQPRKGGSEPVMDNVMLVIYPAIRLTPKDDYSIIDNTDHLKSHIFKTYGHFEENEKAILEAVDTRHQHGGGSERKYSGVPYSSPLYKIIEEDKQNFMTNFKWAGDGYDDKTGQRRWYPEEVVASSFATLKAVVKPLLNKCGFHDFSSGMSFMLVPAEKNNANDLLEQNPETFKNTPYSHMPTDLAFKQLSEQTGTVDVQLEFTYSLLSSHSSSSAQNKGSFYVQDGKLQNTQTSFMEKAQSAAMSKIRAK